MNEAVVQAHYPDLTLLKNQIAPVQMEDTMAEAGRKTLLVDLIKMLEHEAGSRTGDDIEHVHDMRVATRRMRSVFSLLREYYKTKPVRPYIQQLKALGRRLGDVRDLDVMIQDLEEYQHSRDDQEKSAVQGVIDYLDKRRRKARKKLNAFLNSAAYLEFVSGFSAFLINTGEGAKAVDTDSAVPHQVRHILPSIIHDHLATVRAYDTVLYNGNPKTLHALRIEFKRLRYLTSYFVAVLGSSIDGFIGELKEIQDYLGRLNDIVVAQRRLKSLKKRISLDESQTLALDRYIEILAQEETTRIEGFTAVWEKFNTRTVQRKLSDSLLVLR